MEPGQRSVSGTMTDKFIQFTQTFSQIYTVTAQTDLGEEIFTLIAKYVRAPTDHLQLLPTQKLQAVHVCPDAICIQCFLS